MIQPSHLDILPEKTKTLYQKDICTPMLIAVLFIIAKTKQHKCPLTDEWIKMMWYTYILEYYPAIKRMK